MALNGEKKNSSRHYIITSGFCLLSKGKVHFDKGNIKACFCSGRLKKKMSFLGSSNTISSYSK